MKPVQAIEQTMKDIAGLGRSLVKVEESLQGVQKKVNDAECYVNLFRDQPLVRTQHQQYLDGFRT